MLPPLETLLTFRHDRAIRRYQRDFPAMAAHAEQLFADMLRFLWLSRKHELDLRQAPAGPHLDFLVVMYEEMRAIDNMWHSFILYTRDYRDFCQTYFGEFMHHEPDVATTRPQSPQDYARDLGLFLSFTYDHLGEDVVRRWFATHLAA